METQGEQPVVVFEPVGFDAPLFSDSGVKTPELGPAVAFALAEDNEEQPVVALEEDVEEPQGEIDAVEKSYSSKEVAKQFFGKSQQWLYWGLRAGVFVYRDGTPIMPSEEIGMGKRRRYTLPIIREMALACYRRGTLKERGYWEASGSTGKARVTEQGASREEAYDNFLNGRGFNPAKVVYVDGLDDVLARIKVAEKDVISV